MGKTSILFVFFNRKETALKSFQSIKNYKPEKLYLASDGPRNTAERIVVEDIRRAIVGAVDWNCEIKTLFKDKNVGCGDGVYSAICWFFENEECGVILEDDCIAAQTFFPFVEQMLEKYKDDSRIGMIAGYNAFLQKDYPYSYLFSRFKSCWGWASWRRAWQNMDYSMNWRNSPYRESILANSGFQGRDKGKWNFELRCIDKNEVSAWDWQWYFSLARQNQMCIYPALNQISNIGNDINATHTSFSNIERPSFELTFPLREPDAICPYKPFDLDFYKSDHTLRAYISRLIPCSIKNKIKKIILK